MSQTAKDPGNGGATPRGRGRGMLSNSEIAAFCTQIAMIMKSGISVGEGLSIMHDDMENAQGKAILKGLLDRVETGSPLYVALEDSGKFPKYVVDMTEIGESTGRLDDVMDSLCDYYEREEAVAKNIKSAVTYPLIMIVMMLLVILVLIMEVLPIFNDVFVQLGSELTGVSRSMMNLGNAIGRYSVWIVAVMAVLAVVFVILRFTSGGNALLNRFKASFFLTRKLTAKIASGRFASAMALMLASGLDTDQSLDMVYKLVDNKLIRDKIGQCKGLISSGESFSDALVKADIFTGVYARMISVGFRTGSVDTVMQKLAEQYEEEIDGRINGIVSVLEPTLVAILSIIVGMVLLSVMLPLMGIMANIG